MTTDELDLRELKAVSVLGRGAKGVVFLVHRGRSSSSRTLALKAMSRSSIEQRSSAAAHADAYRRIWLERDVLLAVHHPLLPSLRGVVSTEKIVGFAIDRCSGGDLSSLRRRQTEKMFSDDVIRFYAAELVLALEYLHGLGIVYRDLKPENVLIQDNGHIMLVDFDLSTRLPARSPEPESHNRRAETAAAAASSRKEEEEKKKKKKKKKRRVPGCFSCNAGVSPEGSGAPVEKEEESGDSDSNSAGKSNSFVGTEEYVAPEVIRGDGHDYAVDWWSLGIVMYEMLYGRTPFRGETRKETFYRILAKELELVGEPTPLRDLISRLLEKDPRARMTCEEIKRHQFFQGVEWDSLLLISRPPYIPLEEADVDGGTEGIKGIDVEKVVQETFEATEKIPEENQVHRHDDTTEFNVF